MRMAQSCILAGMSSNQGWLRGLIDPSRNPSCTSCSAVTTYSNNVCTLINGVAHKAVCLAGSSLGGAQGAAMSNVTIPDPPVVKPATTRPANEPKKTDSPIDQGPKSTNGIPWC